MNFSNNFLFFLLFSIIVAAYEQPEHRILTTCSSSICYIDPSTNNSVNCPEDCHNCTYNSSYGGPVCLSCNEGAGLNYTSLTCVQCPDNCTQCYENSTNMTCYKCIENNTLNGSGICKWCPSSYFLNLSSDECTPCLTPNCSSCSSDGASCYTCEVGLSLDYSRECSPNCAYNQFYDKINHTGCVQCPENCSSCYYNRSVSSVLCNPYNCNDSYTFDWYSGKCIYCPKDSNNFSNYYSPPKQACLKCPNNCSNCEYSYKYGYMLDEVRCYSCDYGYTVDYDLGVCVPNCSAGYYYNYNYSQCLSCSSNCVTCNATHCKQCQSGIGLDGNGTCFLQCPQNCSECKYSYNYSNSTNETNETSNTSIITCYKCIENNTLNGSGVCKWCPSNCFLNLSTDQCTPCLTPNCSSCSSDGTYCYRCEAGLSLDYSQECTPNCSYNQYYDKINHTGCLQCPENCSSCYYSRNTSSVACSPYNCNYNYEYDWYSGKCIYCPKYSNNFSYYYSSSKQACLKCPNNCTYCESYYKYGFMLDDVRCYSCDYGYTVDYELGVCVPNCSAGYYYNYNASQCLKCPSNNCKTCSFNYYDNKTYCYNCENGFGFDSNGTCAQCPENCSECKYSDNYSNSSNETSNTSILTCYKCIENNTLNGSGVCKWCPSNYFLNLSTDQCTPCLTPNCLSCSSDGTYCYMCEAGLSLDYSQECTPNCSYNQYYDKLNQNGCFPCPENCSSCYYRRNTSSVACTPYNCNYNYNYDWYNGKCIYCPKYSNNFSYYYSSSKQACLKCPNNCTYCESYYKYGFMLDDVRCYSCDYGYTVDYELGVCVPNCSTGYYYNYNASQCLKCSGNNCKTCSFNYYDNKTYCSNCENGFGLDSNGTCAQCPANCSQCKYSYYYTNYTNSSNDSNSSNYSNILTCYQCNDNFTLNGSGVCKWCPSNYFLNLSSDQCVKCNIENCEKCYSNYSNLTVCLQCSPGYVFNYYTLACEINCNNYYSGYYNPITKSCNPCPANCSSCYFNQSANSVRCNPYSCYYLYTYFDGICYYCPSEYGPFYFSKSKGKCIECSTEISNCSSCSRNDYYNNYSNQSNQTTENLSCYNCYPPYVPDPQQKKCVPKCNTSEYYSPNDKKCVSCPKENTICWWNYQYNNVSSQCKNTSFYDSATGNCVYCGQNKYYNYSDSSCNYCPENYSACSWDSYMNKFYGNNSLSCNTNYVMNYQLQCIYCPSGYAYNVNDYSWNTCSKCPENCTSCTFNWNQANCTKCNNSKIANPFTGLCEVDCGENKYFSNTTKSCQSCKENCSRCYNNPNNNTVSCAVCSPGYYNSSANYTDPGVCLKCPGNCKSCISINDYYYSYKYYYYRPNDTYCFYCEEGYSYDWNTSTCKLIKFCPNSTYFSPTTQKCEPCSSNCSVCEWNSYLNASFCFNCINNTYTNNQSGVCTTCPKKGYLYLNNTCTKCPNGCESCYYVYINGTSNLSCSRCSESYTMNWRDYPYLCYHTCQNGSYYSSETNSCKSCPNQNTTCAEIDQNGTLVIENQGCLQNYTLDAFSKNCIYCPTNISYYNLFEGKCENCPAGFCTNGCYFEKYYGKVLCNCDESSLFDKTLGKCVQNCSLGQYYSFVSHKCLTCPANCSACYLQSDYFSYRSFNDLNEYAYCFECKSGFSKTPAGMCLPSCPSNQYYSLETGNCEQCPWENSDCYYSASNNYNYGSYYCNYRNCWSRTSSLLNVIFDNCTEGYGADLSNQGQCSLCPTNCSSCDLNYYPGVTRCFSCKSGNVLDIVYKKCVPSCESGYYYDQTYHKCGKCGNNCANCQWVNKTTNFECLACSSGYKLNNQTGNCEAETICPNNFGYNPIKNECQKCPNGCNSCELSPKYYDGSDYTILTNSDGTELTLSESANMSCISCQSNSYYFDQNLSSCAVCSYALKGCNQCNSSKICVSCNSTGFELNLNKCQLKACEVGKYNKGDGCLPCNATCRSCSGPNGSECTSCGSTSKLVGGKCIETKALESIINSTNISDLNDTDEIANIGESISSFYSSNSSSTVCSQDSDCLNNGTCDKAKNKCSCVSGYWGTNCNFTKEAKDKAAEQNSQILEKLSSIDLNSSSSDNKKIANTLVQMTSVSEINNEKTVNQTFDLIEKLANLSSDDNGTSSLLVNTVSNILDIVTTSNETDSSKKKQQMEKVKNSVDLIIDSQLNTNQTNTPISFKSQNIEITAVKLDTSNKTSMKEALKNAFNSDSDNTTNSDNGTNSTKIVINDEFIDKLSEIQGASVAKTDWSTNIHSEEDSETVINSNIVSLDVKSENKTKYSISNLSTPIEIQITAKSQSNNGTESKCKYFNNDNKKWESEGVTTEKNNSTQTLMCKSSHLTDFSLSEVSITTSNSTNNSTTSGYILKGFYALCGLVLYGGLIIVF